MWSQGSGSSHIRRSRRPLASPVRILRLVTGPVVTVPNLNGAQEGRNRGGVGSFHHVSQKHLDRYLDEFEFRFNNRNNPYIFRDALKELLGANPVRYQELVS